MSSVCWLITTDRPHCFAQSWKSITANWPAPHAVVIVHDEAHELGFTGAVAEGWRRVLQTDCEYVAQMEDDFIYNEPVQLDRMLGVLERHPHLTQMTLKRQAVNHEERLAGGIVEAHPDQYEEWSDWLDVWTETTRWTFSTNPSVFPRWVCERGWPNESESEGKFGAYLRRDFPEARAGIWGGKWDAPRVTHIGERVGCGY